MREYLSMEYVPSYVTLCFKVTCDSAYTKFNGFVALCPDIKRVIYYLSLMSGIILLCHILGNT